MSLFGRKRSVFGVVALSIRITPSVLHVSVFCVFGCCGICGLPFLLRAGLFSLRLFAVRWRLLMFRVVFGLAVGHDAFAGPLV